MAGRFDELFLTVCRQVGGIEGLLKAFFDFMSRKTDFFYECDPGDTMGFPPGVNTKILFSVFKHFQDEHYKKFPKKDPAAYEEKVRKYQQAKAKKEQKVQQKQQSVAPPAPTSTASKDHVQEKAAEPQTEAKSEVPPETKPVEQPNQPKPIEPVINTYNGGATDKYKWSQQSNDVEVSIEVPFGTTSKEINVEMKLQHLKITLKKTGTVIVDGPLYEKISVANSFWRVENSGKQTFVVLNLEKAEQRIWSTVIKGDKEIDTSKVDNSKPLKDFDDETQGALRKIMYEQQRKMQGLPTTEQEQQMEALKTAWNAEGSPFKGTPFDPSKLNFQGGV